MKTGIHPDYVEARVRSIEKLNRELNALLSSPEVIERLAKLGIVATPGTPEQFGEQMRADLAKYGVVVKAAGITAD